LTSEIQRNIEITKSNFEFRNTQNGTQVVIQEMADYLDIMHHFVQNSLHCFTFHTK